jgi:hypothetical protein
VPCCSALLSSPLRCSAVLCFRDAVSWCLWYIENLAHCVCVCLSSVFATNAVCLVRCRLQAAARESLVQKDAEVVAVSVLGVAKVIECAIRPSVVWCISVFVYNMCACDSSSARGCLQATEAGQRAVAAVRHETATMMEEWRLQHTAEMASAFERHNAALRDAEACRLQLEAQVRATAAAEAVAEQRRMLCGALREAAAMAAEDAWGDACRQRDAMQRDHVSGAYACVCESVCVFLDVCVGVGRLASCGAVVLLLVLLVVVLPASVDAACQVMPLCGAVVCRTVCAARRPGCPLEYHSGSDPLGARSAAGAVGRRPRQRSRGAAGRVRRRACKRDGAGARVLVSAAAAGCRTCRRSCRRGSSRPHRAARGECCAATSAVSGFGSLSQRMLMMHMVPVSVSSLSPGRSAECRAYAG